MRNAVTFAADGTTKICNIPHRAASNNWYGDFAVYGSTFGAGTVVFSWSPDNGTTKIPLKDENGTAMSSAANAMFHRSLGTPTGNNDVISIWATMSGSTTPNVTAAVYDNR